MENKKRVCPRTDGRTRWRFVKSAICVVYYNPAAVYVQPCDIIPSALCVPVKHIVSGALRPACMNTDRRYPSRRIVSVRRDISRHTATFYVDFSKYLRVVHVHRVYNHVSTHVCKYIFLYQFFSPPSECFDFF